MGANVNVFTVRRTEQVQPAERPIDWAKDFPNVLNPACGGIEFIRDNRRRLTPEERKVRKANRAAIMEAEVRGALYGVLVASLAFASVIAFALEIL